jgi:hypothetical protein
MKEAIGREIVRAIGEIVPLAEGPWRKKVAGLAAERIEAIVAAETVVESASAAVTRELVLEAAQEAAAEARAAREAVEGRDDEFASVPAAIFDQWAERLERCHREVEAAIEGALGVDDDMLGDLIETLDLVSKHWTWTKAAVRAHGTRVPAFFEASA